MKKNKEWLKAQVKDEECELKSVYDNYVPYEKVLIADDINDLIDQLDEPEITEEQAWKTIAKSMNRPVMFWENMRDDYLNSLKEPELPAIPQFVADWIEENKSKFSILDVAAIVRTEGLVNQKVDDWICKNDEMFVRAWIDGYIIAPENKMQITIKSYDKTELEIELSESESKKLIDQLKEVSE